MTFFGKGNKVKEKLDSFVEYIAEAKYQDTFKEIVTLDDCINFCMEQKKQIPTISGFVFSMQKNYDPRNENDVYIIIQGMIDEQNQPVSLDGKNAVCRILHTKTIDMKLIEFLNGTDKKIYKLYQ